MFLDFVKNISYYISHFILCRYLILNKPLERIIKQFDFYFTPKSHYQSFTLLWYPLIQVSKSSRKCQIENQCFYVLWTHLHTAFANYKCSIFLADYGNSKNKTKHYLKVHFMNNYQKSQMYLKVHHRKVPAAYSIYNYIFTLYIKRMANLGILLYVIP